MEEQTFRRQYSEGVAVQLRVPAQIPKIIEWVRQRGGEAIHIPVGMTSRYRRIGEMANAYRSREDAPEFLLIETSDGMYRLDFGMWVMYEGGEIQVYDQDALEDIFEVPEQSNLVDHAKRELARLGNGPELDDHVIRMIEIFAEQGHSGFSAGYTASIINELLHFKPLTGLTNDPNEWNHISEEQWGAHGGVWQNQRDSEAFSNDGGKTYYLLSEERDKNTGERPIHTAEEARP